MTLYIPPYSSHTITISHLDNRHYGLSVYIYTIFCIVKKGVKSTSIIVVFFPSIVYLFIVFFSKVIF